jgi:succinoglycan biosynthesis transport protein ExoP
LQQSRRNIPGMSVMYESESDFVGLPPKPMLRFSNTLPVSGLDVLRAFYRRKWLIVGLTTGVMALDLAAAAILPKVYKAQVLLQTDEGMRGTAAGGVEVRGIPTDLDGGAMQSQEDMIRTPVIALEVIKSAQLESTPEFRQDAWGARLATYVASVLPAWAADLTGRVLTDQLASPAELERVERDQAIKIFENQLDVSYNLRGTSLWIAYRSIDPAVAAAAANVTAKAYVLQQMKAKIAMLHDAGDWLSERLAHLHRKAEESETALARFKQEHHLGTDQTPAFTQQRLSDLNKQLIVAISDEVAANSRINEAARADKLGDVAQLSTVLDSKEVQYLRQQEIAAKLVLSSAATKGNQPLAAMGAANLAAVRVQLQAGLTRVVSGLRHDANAANARVASIRDAIAAVTKDAAEHEPAYAQAEVLTREASANRAVFDGVVQKAEEIGTMDGLQRPDLHIVSPALIPARPYFPKLHLFLPIGAAVGLLISTSLAFLLERRQQGIRSIDAGERLLGIPGVGWLPSIRRKEKRRPIAMISPVPRSLRDALLVLAASLCALARRQRPIILISSAVSGEGKSTTAVWLARMFAETGKSCLLIDVDRRCPAGSVWLNAREGVPAMDDVIAGRQPLQSAITVNQETGVAVLAAGGASAIPTYDSAAFAATLEVARSQYEVVVIDAPPILASPDALVLAPHCDLALMVVQQERVPAHVVAKAVARLVAGHGKSAIGFMLSRAKLASFHDAYIENYSISYLERSHVARRSLITRTEY